MNSPMTDLAEMLRTLEVVVRPDPYVFAAVDRGSPSIGDAHATIVEDEAMTVVVREVAAGRHGLDTTVRFAWLTLTINSSLEAVGLTAAFSAALATADISCNVLAGFHHDHLLVPYDKRADAVDVLRRLSTDR